MAKEPSKGRLELSIAGRGVLLLGGEKEAARVLRHQGWWGRKTHRSPGAINGLSKVSYREDFNAF